MTKDRLLLLITAYLEDQIQPTDLQELVEYIHENHQSLLLEEAIEEIVKELELSAPSQVPSGEIFQNIVRDSRYQKHRPRHFLPKINSKRKQWIMLGAAAIAFIFVVFANKWLPFVPRISKDQFGTDISSKGIVPGTKKAILTLADGSKINLDTTSNEVLVKQGNAKISVDKGRLLYQQMGNESENTTDLWNTIATPVGGEYQVVLPDGTKAWLNAASSISYPIAFVGKERRVSITGEVYFEVTKNEQQPFFVKAKGSHVEVLGTQFNVSAYPDDPVVNTTLVEGSVQIEAGDNKRLLKPGQQAKIWDKDNRMELGAADTEEILAWKNGYFFFNHEPLESVMKKISRWYDVEIVYEGDLRDRKLDGTLSRMDDINQLLTALEMTETAHFNIQGRRIIVME